MARTLLTVPKIDKATDDAIAIGIGEKGKHKDTAPQIGAASDRDGSAAGGKVLSV